MRVLVVGAGAVGQVYAWHLRAGGAEIAFRTRHRPPEADAGFVLYPLNGRGGELRRLEGALFLLTDAEVAAWRPDLVLLAIPADALLGDWLAPFHAAIGDAQLVSLLPGAESVARLRELRPDQPLVIGLISMIAYHAPLPGETRFPDPGTAFWFPPGGCPFEGPGAERIVDLLRRGGMRAAVRQGVATTSAFGSVTMVTAVAALETEGWALDRFLSGPARALGLRAAAEGHAILSARTGGRPPAALRWLRPWSLALATRLARAVVPLPLEPYLRVHFLKVGAQTLLHLDTMVAHGREAGLPTGALEALAAGVRARRQQAS